MAMWCSDKDNPGALAYKDDSLSKMEASDDVEETKMPNASSQHSPTLSTMVDPLSSNRLTETWNPVIEVNGITFADHRDAWFAATNSAVHPPVMKVGLVAINSLEELDFLISVCPLQAAPGLAKLAKTPDTTVSVSLGNKVYSCFVPTDHLSVKLDAAFEQQDAKERAQARIIYHGTCEAHALFVYDRIRVDKGYRLQDFCRMPAFYCTTNFRQAAERAVQACRRIMHQQGGIHAYTGGDPTVVAFEFTGEDSEGLIFRDANESWQRMVYYCRNDNDSDPELELPDGYNNAQFVFGPVLANPTEHPFSRMHPIRDYDQYAFFDDKYCRKNLLPRVLFVMPSIPITV